MQNLYKDLLDNYIEMLDIHIDCKQTDMPFHEETEHFYEKLFEIAHELGERHVDDWHRTRTDSLDEQKQRANDIANDTVRKIQDQLESENISIEARQMLEKYLEDAKKIQEWTKKFL